jgi:hypothetical protein
VSEVKTSSANSFRELSVELSHLSTSWKESSGRLEESLDKAAELRRKDTAALEELNVRVEAQRIEASLDKERHVELKESAEKMAESVHQIRSNLSVLVHALHNVEDVQDRLEGKIDNLTSLQLEVKHIEKALSEKLERQKSEVDATVSLAIDGLSGQVKALTEEEEKSARRVSSLSDRVEVVEREHGEGQRALHRAVENVTATATLVSHDLRVEMKESLASFTVKAHEMVMKSLPEMTSLRSQVDNLTSSLSRSEAVAEERGKETSSWRKDVEDQLKRMEDVLQIEKVARAVAEEKLRAQGEELQVLRAQGERDHERALEREKEWQVERLKEKEERVGKGSDGVACASQKEVDQLRALLWDLQAAVVGQSGRAIDMLLSSQQNMAANQAVPK